MPSVLASRYFKLWAYCSLPEVQITYIIEIIDLYEIYKTKYEAIVIIGSEKILIIRLVFANSAHHAMIRKTGHTIQSIPEE